jgi:hypothetical protein
MFYSPAVLARLLLSALEPDKFYSPDNARRRFAAAGVVCSSDTLLDAARAMGWIIDYPDRGELVIPAFCWLITRQMRQHSVKVLEQPTINKESAPTLSDGPLFSYYRSGIRNTTPYATITLTQLYAELISDRHRPLTEAVRTAPVGSVQRHELKKRLDYVTPAGTFTHRANSALVASSGLLVLDFDHLLDLVVARAALLADAQMRPALKLLFISPSGDGLKAIVETDPTGTHLDNFHAYRDYLAAHYKDLRLVPDKQCKEVSRACFVPYDPAAWFAEV